MTAILVPISAGDLIDKTTILRIKSTRINDPAKLSNVRAELTVLESVAKESLHDTAELSELTAQLQAVNEALWQIEDDIRGCEANQDFGPHFIQLARAVYHHNDHRAALKRDINTLVGSPLVEEKQYATYPCRANKLDSENAH